MAEDDGAGADPELAPPPPPPPLPSYSEMILEAIDALGNANGSNKTAISGYLKSKYSASLPSDHTSLLTSNLGRMKSSGELVFARNNYLRPDDGDDEEVQEEEPTATAPASPLRPGGHKDLVVDEDFTGLFDADSFSIGFESFDDIVAELGDADDIDVPAPAPDGVAADDIHVPAPAPDGVAADDIDVPAPAPDGVAADDIHVPAPAPDGVAAAGPVKRGRGRPPKPKVAVAEESPAETSQVASDAVAPAKGGRGRAPKPKDPAAMGTDGESTADANAPVKRGRGRPPKPKDPVTDETISRATSGMLSPRGRPPKKAKVEEAPSTAVPVKRGRGRPPKVKH